MENQFDKEQLMLIRDTFAEMCTEAIEHHRKGLAELYLGIVNVTQNELGSDKFDDIDEFYRNESGIWNESEVSSKKECEEDAISSMIAWAKSTETEPTGALYESLEKYFSSLNLNKGSRREDVIENKGMFFDKLVIGCIYKCNQKELSKLDGIKDMVASHN